MPTAPDFDTSRTPHVAPRSSRWLLVGVIVLVALAFAPTLGFDFVNWDDDLHVYRNPAVTGTEPVSARELLLTPRLGYPIPVTLASYRLEHAAFGLEPAWFHATNVLLHLATCWILFVLARRLGASPLAAAVAVAIFGLHPAAAEPVSWVSGRKDLLAALFGFWSLAEHVARPFAPRRPRTWVSPALFLLAALSKPVVLLLPLVMVGVHVWQRREGLARAALAALPSAAISAFVLALALRGQGAVGAIYEPPSVAVWLRNIWYALGYHLGVVSFVQPPAPKHLVAAMPPAFDPAVDLLPLAWLVGLAALVWLARSQRGLALFGLGLALAVYVPSSSVVPIMRFLADSYVYMALAGVGLVVGAAVQRLERRAAARPQWLGLVAAASALTLVLFAGAISTSAHWRDGVALWSRMYERYPASPQVCRQYGNALNEANWVREALDQYTACARRFGPEHFEKNIAITLFLLGEHAEARRLFEQLGRARPDDPTVRRYLERLGPGDAMRQQGAASGPAN